MNLFSSQLLMWRGSSDEQEDGGEGCDDLSASPEAGVQLLDRLLDPRAPRRELGRRLRVEGVRGHRDGVLGGAVLHHHLVDHVEVAPRRRVVLVAAVLLELRRRDAAADGLWRGAVRELWRGAVCERGLGRRNCVARTTARQPIEFCVEPRYGGTISALVGRKRIEKTSAAWMPPIMTATGRISLILRRAFYRRSGAISQGGGGWQS